MEAGIKDRYLRHAGHHLLAGADAREVMGVMKRPQLATFLDSCDDAVIYYDRAGEFFAAVKDSVTHCADLRKRIYNAVFLRGQGVKHELHRFGMVIHMNVELIILSALDLLLEVAAIDTDTVSLSLCKHLVVFHIDKLILYRRAARVYNENFH